MAFCRQLFDRTVLGMLFVGTLVGAAAIVVLKISRGDWIGVVVSSGFLGFYIWLVVRFARESDATTRNEDPISGQHPPPRRGRTGFRLQRRLWPSADRLFSRSVMGMLLVIMLVSAVAGLVLKISRGAWIDVAFQVGILGLIIWLVVRFVRRTQPPAAF